MIRPRDPAVEWNDPLPARVHESVPGAQLLGAPPAELDVRRQVAPVASEDQFQDLRLFKIKRSFCGLLSLIE